MTTKTKTKSAARAGAYVYNITGAAEAIGKSASTISAAVKRGDIKVALHARGSDGKQSALIEPHALRAYVETLVARARAFNNQKEIDQLRCAVI